MEKANMENVYDSDGVPITDWRVALDRVNDLCVSTVWLSVDHQFGDGPPLIFETMVFDGDESSDLLCRRYSTMAQAKAGHAEVLAKCTSEPDAVRAGGCE
jgi:hypothetical protein